MSEPKWVDRRFSLGDGVFLEIDNDALLGACIGVDLNNPPRGETGHWQWWITQTVRVEPHISPLRRRLPSAGATEAKRDSRKAAAKWLREMADILDPK